MREWVFILTLATTLVACASATDAGPAPRPRCPANPPDPVVARRCLAVPQARDYLEHAQKQVLDAWQVPRDVSADESVEVTFRLNLDGSLQCLSPSPNPNESLTRSVVSALYRVTPFAPVPSEAACLGELAVVASFSNPLEK